MCKDPKPRDFLTQYRMMHRHDPGPKYDVELDILSLKSMIDARKKIRP